MAWVSHDSYSEKHKRSCKIDKESCKIDKESCKIDKESCKIAGRQVESQLNTDTFIDQISVNEKKAVCLQFGFYDVTPSYDYLLYNYNNYSNQQ